MSSGGSDGNTTSTVVQPYAPAEPGLNQIYLKQVLYTDKAQKQQDMLHRHNKLYKVWVHRKLLQVLQINKY